MIDYKPFQDFKESVDVKVNGFLRITEKETGKVLLNRHNDIHYEHMSLAIAQAMGRRPKHGIKEICLGNGGVKVNAANEYIYTSPQTIGSSASLHNQTYSKVVDDLNTDENDDPIANYMEVQHITGNYYTDLLIRCTLEKNEPSDQNTSYTNTDIISDYSFSEVGLKTYAGDLITHLVFSPVYKQASITLVFDYLLRFQIV